MKTKTEKAEQAYQTWRKVKQAYKQAWQQANKREGVK